MVRKMRVVVAALFAAALALFGAAPVSALATDDTSSAFNWDISKSKEATNLDENFTSKVTLSLPAADYKGDLDVVFVLDGSTSTDSESKHIVTAAKDMLDLLVDYQNLNVKVGLVIFGGSKPILYSDDLLSLANEDNVSKLKSDIEAEYKGWDGRSGSNLQAGVDAAQAMLDNDSAVKFSDKYMIILSDGGARMWVNDDGEAMSQTYVPYGSIFWGSNEDFNQRYMPQTDESKKRLPSFEDVWSAGENNPDFAKWGMTKKHSQEASTDEAASGETFRNGEYYTTYEVATYYAAKSIVAASQKCNVIWVDYPYYPDKYEYFTYTESFKFWLAEQGYVTRKTCTVDPKDEETQKKAEDEAKEIFSEVKDQLTYLLDAGSTVVDYMGYVEGDYNLDFVNDVDTLALTVDGQQKTTVKLGENHYGFGGLLDSGKYEFELTYYPADNADERFQLDINVPVTKDKPVKLSYQVKLVNPKTAAGTYGVYDQFGENNDGSADYDLYTNNMATLYPVDSNGNEGTPEDFKKPTVSYEVKATPTPEPPTPETKKKVSVPKTGDPLSVAGIVALLGAGAAGIGAGSYLHKKRR